MAMLWMHTYPLQTSARIMTHFGFLQGAAKEIASQQGAATAVALAAPNGDPTAYFVGHNAALKIHSLSTGSQASPHPCINLWAAFCLLR